MPHPERSLIQIWGAGKQNSEEVNLGNGDVCLQDVKKRKTEREDKQWNPWTGLGFFCCITKAILLKSYSEHRLSKKEKHSS